MFMYRLLAFHKHIAFYKHMIKHTPPDDNDRPRGGPENGLSGRGELSDVMGCPALLDLRKVQI